VVKGILSEFVRLVTKNPNLTLEPVPKGAGFNVFSANMSILKPVDNLVTWSTSARPGDDIQLLNYEIKAFWCCQKCNSALVVLVCAT